MESPPSRLVHQVNNLLAVIQTQVAVADALGTHEAAQSALEQIQKCADRLALEVKEQRRLERGTSGTIGNPDATS